MPKKIIESKKCQQNITKIKKISRKNSNKKLCQQQNFNNNLI